MRTDDYGAFGLAWKTASTLRGSYQRAERYARVLTSVSTYEVEETDGGAYMHLHRQGDRRLGMRLSNEATIASIVSISREVYSGDFTPLEVHFKHTAPASIIAHEEYFGCPVQFGSDRDALLVSSAKLHTPNRLGDRSISSFFDGYLEEVVSKFAGAPGIDQQVLTEVCNALSEGVPMISAVASRLGMSGRTLQRRLADEGHSYQALVVASRRQLAERLLQNTDYALTEVAFMTGFSEQSAFTRAFKRWSGQTPRSYRKRFRS
jgi:AraC-like DNA-binding protein